MNDAFADTSNAHAPHRPTDRLTNYHRIVLLTDGFSTPFLAKTAISMLRYRTADIAAVFDATQAGQTTQALFLTGGDIPVIGSFDEYFASNDKPIDALFVGIAPPGGHLPAHWRSIVLEALNRGIDIVSGLHDFLSHDQEFREAAIEKNCSLIDVRKNTERNTAKRADFREGCLRIHTVGHDCSVGKMVTALEIQRELVRRNIDAKFLATGQTGIMVAGEGVPIDCVIADFVNGAAENLVQRNEQHEVLLIEGQGSISHPSYSAVTLGLLHGCAPHGLIFCYEVGRKVVKGLDDIPLLENRKLIEMLESNASMRHPCRVIGIAMNSRHVSQDEATGERERIAQEFGLPVCDVYRDGAGELADAVEKLRKELVA